MTIAGLGLVLSNIGYGYSIILTKKLKEYHSFQIAYHLGIMYIMSCGLIYCGSGQYKLTMSNFILGLIFTGVPNTIAVITNITAVQLTKNSGVLTIVTFSRVIMGYFMSVFVYHESQNPICLIGVILVVAGVSKTIFDKSN